MVDTLTQAYIPLPYSSPRIASQASQSSPLSAIQSSPLVTPYGQVRTPRRSQEVRKLIFENKAIQEATRSDEIAKQFLDKVAIGIDRKTT